MDFYKEQTRIKLNTRDDDVVTDDYRLILVKIDAFLEIILNEPGVLNEKLGKHLTGTCFLFNADKYAPIFLVHPITQVVDIMFQLMYKNWFIIRNEELMKSLWNAAIGTPANDHSFEIRISTFCKILQYEITYNNFMNEECFTALGNNMQEIMRIHDALLAFALTCKAIERAYIEVDIIEDIVVLLYNEIEECNAESGVFACCIRVLSRQFNVIDIISKIINMHNYSTALISTENSESFTELIVQCIKFDESDMLGISIIQDMIFSDTPYHAAKKSFKIKANTLRAMYRIIKNTSIEFVKARCINIIAKLLELCESNSIYALKLIILVIENEMLTLSDELTDDLIYKSFNEVLDTMDEEDQYDHEELISRIDAFFDDGD